MALRSRLQMGAFMVLLYDGIKPSREYGVARFTFRSGLFQRLDMLRSKTGLHLRAYITSDTLGAGVPSSLTMLSASPTCFLVLTSPLRNLDLIARIIVNLWVGPLMTTDCYCRGSKLEDKRFRWR